MIEVFFWIFVAYLLVKSPDHIRADLYPTCEKRALLQFGLDVLRIVIVLQAMMWITQSLWPGAAFHALSDIRHQLLGY